MKVAIYGRQHGAFIIPFVEQLLNELDSHHCEYGIYESFYNFLAQQKVNLNRATVYSSSSELSNHFEVLVSVGGDGTILDTVSLVNNSGIPVVGINTGRMGFLSSVSKDHLHGAVEKLLKGNYTIDKRSLLRLESTQKLFNDGNNALNELTIHKKDSSTMITIHTYLNGEFLNSYWADGLIISTPTGSTGYSLSCGGPIIMPQSENFVITPIAPHNLNVRPIIVSDKNVISLEVEGRSRYYLATLDSRSITIDSSIQIAVRKEDYTFNLVRFDTENFLNTIRAKLSWGLDSRN